MGNASTNEHSTAASKRFAGGTEMGELIGEGKGTTFTVKLPLATSVQLNHQAQV